MFKKKKNLFIIKNLVDSLNLTNRMLNKKEFPL